MCAPTVFPQHSLLRRAEISHWLALLAHWLPRPTLSSVPPTPPSFLYLAPHSRRRRASSSTTRVGRRRRALRARERAGRGASASARGLWCTQCRLRRWARLSPATSRKSPSTPPPLLRPPGKERFWGSRLSPLAPVQIARSLRTPSKAFEGRRRAVRQGLALYEPPRSVFATKLRGSRELDLGRGEGL
jgi:hypothetical protein